jgi:predicted enzyme related to lactoylglutathione lyase
MTADDATSGDALAGHGVSRRSGISRGTDQAAWVTRSTSRYRREHIMGSPIVHFEVIGKDAAGLREFYTELFGWEIGELMPDMGNYGLIDGASSGLAGGVGQSDDKPRVTVYVQVPDLQATLDKVVALGGAVVMPPTEIPGVTWLALFTDPDGNVFGLTKGS